MVEVEVIRQQYPAVMWRFSLVIEECGIIQLPALSLLHTHCVIQFSAVSASHTLCYTVLSSVSASHTLCSLLHLCFGESFDKEDCFWNSQLSLWMVGIKNFITKGVCCVFVSFVCNSQGQIFLLSFMKFFSLYQLFTIY